MAEEVAAGIPALERANRRKLTWLRIREQGFFFLMVMPVILLIIFFFVVPLVTLFLRSFEDGSRGLAIEREVVNEIPDGIRTTFTVDNTPLFDRNLDNEFTVDDVEIQVGRPIVVTFINAEAGEVTLEKIPSQQEAGAITIAYNDVSREVLFRRLVTGRGCEGNICKVKEPPIRDVDGDGRVTSADVRVLAEGDATVISVDAETGAITLAEPPAPGQEVAVKYNYSNSPTIFQYSRALGFADVREPNFYWDWALWKRSLFRTTFEIAFWTTIGSLVIGYPVAYILANVAAQWRTILMVLVLIPIWTSLLVRTFAWKIILGTAGPINDALGGVGIVGDDDPLIMVFNRFGVYVGMIHILVPFLIFPVFAVMRGIPEHLPKAAESLGASPMRSFLRVYLPLSLPGVAAGSLLVFILSLGFFITPALLGGGGDRMVANLIAIHMQITGNWELAAALGFLLLAITLVFFFIWNRFMSFEQLYGGRTQAAAAAGPQEFQNPLTRLFAYVSPQWSRFKSKIGDAVSYLSQRWDVVWDNMQYWLRNLPTAVTVAFSLVSGIVLMILLARFIYDTDWKLIYIFLVGLPVFIGLSILGTRWFQAPLRRVMLSLFVGLVFIFLIAPTFIVVPISFTSHPVFLSFPGSCCTLESYQSYFGISGAGHFARVGQWVPATIASAEVAILVVIFAVPLGSLAAYGLVRGRFPGKAVLNSLIIAPLVVPLIIVAIGVFMFFARYMKFMLGSVVSLGPFDLPLGFVVAHSLLAIPYVVIIVSAALRGVDETLEQASMSLGASRLTTLRRVVFPMVLPAMVASAFFAFLVSWDELIIAIFLSSSEVTTLPKRIWDGIRFEVDPTISAIATMLIFLTILMLAAIALSQWYFARRRRL